MKNVQIIIGTSMVGSEKKVDSGYTPNQWMLLSEDEKSDVINEKVWDNIHAYADIEDGVE